MSSYPLVPLGGLLNLAPDPHEVDPDAKYPIAGVYGFGRGMIQRAAVAGREMAATQLFRIRAGQFIYSRLKSFEGAYAIVSPEVDGYFVSNEFPTFDLHREQLDPGFLGWYFKQDRVWQQLASDGKGIGARRERLHPTRFLDHAIALPPIEEQRQITARLESAAAQMKALHDVSNAVRIELNATREATFRKVIDGAPRVAMGDVAPLVRRSVEIDPDETYTEIGVRSFYKGVFHRRTVKGTEFTWQKLFRIAGGDLVFSNLMAWEKAIALASARDDGCVGNHRMLTCEVVRTRCLPTFLWYYFTTAEGLAQVVAASPGSIARNKTLSAELLSNITVPLPSLDAQHWFEALHTKTIAADTGRVSVGVELNRSIPALLHQVFG